MANFNQGTGYAKGSISSDILGTASRSSSGSNTPSKSCDTNTTSFWYSGDPSLPDEFIKFDIGTAYNSGSPYRIGAAVLGSKFGFDMADGAVEVSNDNTNWTQVATWSAGTFDQFDDQRQMSGEKNYYISWNHVNARYIRFRQTAASHANGWAIAEMQLFPGAALAAPTLSSPAIPTGGTTLTATLSQSGITPASGSGTGGFTLSGTNRTVTAWSISGTTLTLTLSAAVGTGKTVTYSYDGSGAFTNGDNAMATFSGVSVTNNSTVGAPTVSSPVIPSTGQTITATLSQSGCSPTSGSGAGGFTVTGLDTPRTVTGWSISGTTLTLTISGKAGAGDTGVLLSYDSGTGTITNGDTVMASFTDTAVTNNSTESLGSVPTRMFFGLV